MTAPAGLPGENPRGRSSADLLNLGLALAIPLASSIALTFLTAAWLGVEGRGQFALVTGTSTLLASLLFGSLHIGVARATHQHSREGAFASVVYPVCALAAGFSVLALLAWPIIPSFSFGQYNQSDIVLIAITTALMVASLIALRSIQALGASRVYRNALIVQSATSLLLGVAGAAGTRSAYVVVGAWSVAVIASTVYGIVAVGRVFPYVRTLGTPPIRSRKLALQLSLAPHMASMGQQLLLRGDIVVLGALSTSIAIGLYSVATPIASLVWVIAEAISLYALQRAVSTPKGAVMKLWHRVLKMYLVGGLLATLAVAAGTVVLLPLALPDFRGAVPLVLLLLPGAFVQGFARVSLGVLSAHGGRKLQSALGLAAAILGLSYVPMIALYGVTGAAIASSSIYLIYTGVVLWFVRGALSEATSGVGPQP